MLMRLFISAFGIGAGFILLLKTREVVDFTGANDWIENIFGSGKTYTFYKLSGALIIFIFFLYLIGDLNSILRSLIKLIFP